MARVCGSMSRARQRPAQRARAKWLAPVVSVVVVGRREGARRFRGTVPEVSESRWDAARNEPGNVLTFVNEREPGCEQPRSVQPAGMENTMMYASTNASETNRTWSTLVILAAGGQSFQL